LVHCSGWVYWLYTSISWYTAVGGFTGYIPVYVSTLQWVGLLAIYQYMLVHCSGWVYWLYTSISWYTAVAGFTGYIPVYVGTVVSTAVYQDILVYSQ
jgi:transposase